MFNKIQNRLLQSFSEDLVQIPEPILDRINVTYLGTAGFVFSSEDRDIVVDPFITRPSPAKSLLQSLHCDSALISQVIPKADDVLVGHAHHDHVLDAPALCQMRDARLIGSSDVANVARAFGLAEENIVETIGKEDIPCGENAVVRGIPSAHGKVYFGRVPLQGNIGRDFLWPSPLWKFRHGQVLNWYIQIQGLSIMHVDSAAFFEHEWTGLKADVLCLCAIGRHSRPNYVEDAVRILQPKIVMACHWDCFWVPFHEKDQKLLPTVDLEGFVEEIKKAGAKPAVLPIGGQMRL